MRTKAWQLESIQQSDDAVSVSMFTESDDSTRKWWPFDFRLVHRATFGAELTLELIMINLGSTPLRFEEALHAYYNVGDVTKAHVAGLDRTEYVDKTDSYRKKTQQGDVVITSETDRVYLNTSRALELSDPMLHRQISVTKVNSLTTVVWNPWIEKARAMSDLGEDEWKQITYIEVTNVGDFAVELAPGQEHTMKAVVR